MLVLTRRIGEQIVINGAIRVMVVGVQRNTVQLGTSAPSSVTVDRSEVHEERGEFAYQCDWSQQAPTTPVVPSREGLAADLTDAAYRVALQHGLGEHWLEMQLDLWKALTETLEKGSSHDKEIELPYDPRLD